VSVSVSVCVCVREMNAVVRHKVVVSTKKKIGIQLSKFVAVKGEREVRRDNSEGERERESE